MLLDFFYYVEATPISVDKAWLDLNIIEKYVQHEILSFKKPILLCSHERKDYLTV